MRATLGLLRETGEELREEGTCHRVADAIPCDELNELLTASDDPAARPWRAAPVSALVPVQEFKCRYMQGTFDVFFQNRDFHRDAVSSPVQRQPGVPVVHAGLGLGAVHVIEDDGGLAGHLGGP